MAFSVEKSLPVSSRKFDFKAVHTAALKPCSSHHTRTFSHVDCSSGLTLAEELLAARSTNPMLFGPVPSRAARSLIASDANARGLRIYLVVISVPATRSITSVRRASLETLENSTGKRGPSGCHIPSRGKSRGSQMSEPQPRITIDKEPPKAARPPVP